MSLPSRERGLKFDEMEGGYSQNGVAPFAGAWIEIVFNIHEADRFTCRSLRGSVD